MAAFNAPKPAYEPPSLDELRTVPGHIGYKITPNGKIVSFLKRSGHTAVACDEPQKIIKPQRGSHHYQVNIRCDKRGTDKTILVHKLVMLAYVGPKPFNGAHIRHIDGDAYNNRIDNLAYGTVKENNGDDRRRHGTIPMGEKHSSAKLTDAAVREIRASALPLRHFAEKYGVTKEAVSCVRRRRTWRHL